MCYWVQRFVSFRFVLTNGDRWKKFYWFINSVHLRTLRLFAFSVWTFFRAKLIFKLVWSNVWNLHRFIMIHQPNRIVSAEPFKRTSYKCFRLYLSIQWVHLTNCLILWMSICLLMHLFTFTVDRVFMQNVCFLHYLWHLQNQKWFACISIPLILSTDTLNKLCIIWPE